MEENIESTPAAQDLKRHGEPLKNFPKQVPKNWSHRYGRNEIQFLPTYSSKYQDILALALLSGTTMAQTESAVSFTELKRLAQTMLKQGSVLRSLILSEPDYLPRTEALVKISVYVKLLYQEARQY